MPHSGVTLIHVLKCYTFVPKSVNHWIVDERLAMRHPALASMQHGREKSVELLDMRTPRQHGRAESVELLDMRTTRQMKAHDQRAMMNFDHQLAF